MRLYLQPALLEFGAADHLVPTLLEELEDRIREQDFKNFDQLLSVLSELPQAEVKNKAKTK